MRKLTPFSVALAVMLTAALTPASASAGDGPAVRSGPDTTPPDAYIRARVRQDMDHVLRYGIQATCGTSDDEQPLRCRMTALRKGRVLAVGVGHFDRPYNRYHFNLRLARADRKRFRAVDHSVDVKLRLRATDRHGNADVVKKRIRVVRGLWSGRG